MGLALTRVITTSEMAGSVGPFTVVILSFVSGVFLAPNLLPQWLLNFSTYLPLEPIVSGMQHAIALPGGSDSSCDRLSCWASGAWSVS